MFVVLLQGCTKDGVSSKIPPGTYKGIFYRSSSNVRYASSQVSITVEGNRFTGTTDTPKYPAICSGSFTTSDNLIKVTNDCMFTADFDWSFIFKGDYQYEFDGTELRITKNYPNSIEDQYILQKQ